MVKASSLQRRPFLTPIWLSVLAALFGFGVLCVLAWEWATADLTLVIVVQAEDPDGSGLTAAGQGRAESLSRMFGEGHAPGHIAAIYVSPDQRDRLTAAPLAAKLGMAPIIVAADTPQALARRVLREHPGARVLIVEHGADLPRLVAALSGGRRVPDEADDRGILYVVAVPRIGRADFVRLLH